MPGLQVVEIVSYNAELALYQVVRPLVGDGVLLAQGAHTHLIMLH